jgi:uncharacterized peroxidase-related enzyme
MTQRLPILDSSSAPEASAPLFGQLKAGLGMVPNLFATIGHSPGSLQGLLSWDAALGRNGLTKREIEQLNLHVSELNGCGYCISAHTALGGRVGLNPTEIESARNGAGANARENALLALARRVVRTGGGNAGTELARAREAGVSDAQIIDALAIVALKTFTNAVAQVAQTPIDFPKAPRLPTP